jgi:RHS repeat-associated protein
VSFGRYCSAGPYNGYLYFAGKLISGKTDRLGSQRSGLAYYPWGEDNPSSQASSGQVAFATYWRDMAGQDYADQRYYNSNAGRFYTADRGGIKTADLSNPTSWNRYAYAYDDPVNYYDPRGRFACNPDVCGDDSGDDEGDDDSDLAYQVGRQVSPPPPAVSDKTMERRWKAAVARAIKALQNNPLCDSLFGLTGPNGNSSPDPVTLLNQIVNSGWVEFGPIASQTTGNVTTVTSATTTGQGTNNLPIGNGASMMVSAGVQILINDIAGSFVTGSPADQAVTVLHELGHAYWDMYGPGTTLIQPDGRSAPPGVNGVKASEANTALVKKDCNP